MTTKFSNQILTDILNAYGSLSTPSWSFSEKRYATHPYIELINRLGSVGDIQETTDLNDDVSVVLFASVNGSGGVTIKLSLVGKYACLSDSAGRFLSEIDLKEKGDTQLVLELLQHESIILLEPSELVESISFGDGEATLYEVLFSSDEAIG